MNLSKILLFIYLILFSNFLKSDNPDNKIGNIPDFSDESIESIISRLDLHVEFIVKLCKRNNYIKNTIFKSESNIIAFLEDENIKFTNKLICNCIDEIKKTKRLDPLLYTWKNWAGNREISSANNIFFIKQFSTLILVIYKNILVKILPQSIKNIPIAEIIEIYQHSLQLPIDRIIEVLDRLYSRIVHIINSIDTDPQLNWTEWLIKYWHIPTTILAGIITLIINKLHYDYKLI